MWPIPDSVQYEQIKGTPITGWKLAQSQLKDEARNCLIKEVEYYFTNDQAVSADGTYTDFIYKLHLRNTGDKPIQDIAIVVTHNGLGDTRFEVSGLRARDTTSRRHVGMVSDELTLEPIPASGSGVITHTLSLQPDVVRRHERVAIEVLDPRAPGVRTVPRKHVSFLEVLDVENVLYSRNPRIVGALVDELMLRVKDRAVAPDVPAWTSRTTESALEEVGGLAKCMESEAGWVRPVPFWVPGFLVPLFPDDSTAGRTD